jgi:hypothetical protein
VDFVAPRVYVDQVEELIPMMDDWQPAMQDDDRITLSLKSSVGQSSPIAPKSPDQLLAEIWIARAAGSNGVIIFELNGLSDEGLEALAAGPFPAPAAATDN